MAGRFFTSAPSSCPPGMRRECNDGNFISDKPIQSKLQIEALNPSKRDNPRDKGNANLENAGQKHSDEKQISILSKANPVANTKDEATLPNTLLCPILLDNGLIRS